MFLNEIGGWQEVVLTYESLLFGFLLGLYDQVLKWNMTIKMLTMVKLDTALILRQKELSM